MSGTLIPLFPDSGTDAAKLQGFPVSTADPASGNVLVYDSSTRQWVPVSKATAGLAELSGGTFSGNVTMNGTANTAPNQTAASGSSLMTRDLGDARYPLISESAPPIATISTFTATSTTNASGGFVANYTNYLQCRAAASTAGSASTVRISPPAVGGSAAGSASYIDFSKKTFFGAGVYAGGENFLAGTCRLLFGGSNSYAPTADPALKCVGWRWSGRTLYAVMHDGTTYSEPGSSATFFGAASSRSESWLAIVGDGAGGFTWYGNGSVIATTSSGPTTRTANNEGYMILSCYAVGSNTYVTDAVLNMLAVGYRP